jgi:hypothetical protein
MPCVILFLAKWGFFSSHHFEVTFLHVLCVPEESVAFKLDEDTRSRTAFNICYVCIFSFLFSYVKKLDLFCVGRFHFPFFAREYCVIENANMIAVYVYIQYDVCLPSE